MTTDKISEEEQDNYLWQWTENSGIFHTYDRTVQDHIEKCFQQGTFTIDLQNAFPHMPYVINLATMTQMRKSTSRIRPIRRFLLPGENLEGIAFVEDPEKGDEENRIESESTLAEPRLRRSRRKRSCSVKTSEPIGGGMSHQELMSSSAGQDVQFGLISHLTRGLSTIKDTVASVWTGRQKRPKSSQRGNDMSLPIFMPRPPYFPVEERTPVENVKLPSEISIIQTNPRRADEILALYSAVASSTPEDENCCICFEQFDRPSSGAQENPTVSLRKCNHFFHKDCLRAMYDSGFQAGFLQCPVCKTLYGTKIGNQPPGEMTYYSLPCSIPSYPDCDTIRIIYHISPGIQTKEHPHPGKNYTCRGFPRHCYLPDNEEGRLILRLLVLAWERRLIFTVGTSATTGESDTITWNEIHHKTEFGSNVTGHGYPDPLYFDHVLQELALQGVVVSEDEKIS